MYFPRGHQRQCEDSKLVIQLTHSISFYSDNRYVFIIKKILNLNHNFSIPDMTAGQPITYSFNNMKKYVLSITFVNIKKIIRMIFF